MGNKRRSKAVTWSDIVHYKYAHNMSLNQSLPVKVECWPSNERAKKRIKSFSEVEKLPLKYAEKVRRRRSKSTGGKA